MMASALAFVGCEPKTASPPEVKTYRMSTGPKEGNYYTVGMDMKSFVDAHWRNADEAVAFQVDFDPSEGSSANLDRLQMDPNDPQKADLGIVQSDAFDAYLESLAATGAQPRIQILLPLYRELVTLVARTNINSLKSLKGRKVGVGKKGSGSYANAVAVLEAAGVRDCELVPIDGLSKALEKIQGGEIDAFFQTLGHPSETLIKVLNDRTNADLHIVSIWDTLQANASKAQLRHFVHGLSVPGHWYGNAVSPDCKTVGVTALLCCRRDALSKEDAYSLLRMFYTEYNWHQSEPSALKTLPPAQLVREWQDSLRSTKKSPLPKKLLWHEGTRRFAEEADWWATYFKRDPSVVNH
jgi:TRAP transporter TAXI family solute receptor